MLSHLSQSPSWLLIILLPRICKYARCYTETPFDNLSDKSGNPQRHNVSHTTTPMVGTAIALNPEITDYFAKKIYIKILLHKYWLNYSNIAIRAKTAMPAAEIPNVAALFQQLPFSAG